MEIQIKNDVKEEFIKINNFFEKQALSSNVVSSHWKEYGQKTLISFNKNYCLVNIKPEGFDDWRPNSLLNRIKNIPIKIFLRKKLYRLLSDRLINSVDDVIEAQKELFHIIVLSKLYALTLLKKLMFASAEKK